jgi:hypothetical protein
MKLNPPLLGLLALFIAAPLSAQLPDPVCVTQAQLNTLDSMIVALPNGNPGNARKNAMRAVIASWRRQECPAPPEPQPDTSAVTIEISPASGPSILPDSTIQFAAVVRDSSGTIRAYTVTWSTDNPAVATINAPGLARGVAPGLTNVRAAVAPIQSMIVLEVRTPDEPEPPDPPDPGEDWDRILRNETITDPIVPNGEKWLFAEGVVVLGNLRTDGGVIAMRSGSSITLRDRSGNPASRLAYVGGGLRYSPAMEQDIGIWVGGSGSLDIQCTPKVGWNRTGSDPTWGSSDEYWITPTEPGDFEPRRWTPGQPVPQVDPRVPAAEVVNVTRDCTIRGPGHIHNNSNQPSRIEYVRLERMGVFRQGGGDGMDGVLSTGRYAMHFHFQGEGSRGTVVRGVAAVNSQGRVFVPHESHGITFEDNVSVGSIGEGFWWDHGDQTHDVAVDRLLVTGVYAPRDSTGVASYLPGVVLMFGENMSMTNSVVAGVYGTTESHGFNWPEHPACNCERSVWTFDDNVTHNNSGRNLRFWINDIDPHDVHRLVSYRSGQGAVENGAYQNSVRYFDAVIFDDFVQHKSSSASRLGDGEPARWIRPTIISGPRVPIALGNAALPPGGTTTFEDCNLVTTSPILVDVLPNEMPVNVLFRRCGIQPSQVRWGAGVTGVVTIEDARGARQEMRR